MIDWGEIRAHKFASDAPPSDWPAGVRVISVDGTALFGVDDDNQLYWDGKVVELRSPLSLTAWQKVGAVLLVLGTASSGLFTALAYFAGR